MPYSFTIVRRCDRRKLNGLGFRFLAILVIFSTINNARAQNIEDDDLYEVSISLTKMVGWLRKQKYIMHCNIGKNKSLQCIEQDILQYLGD